MENFKIYEPMNYAVDVWDGIVENSIYAAYFEDDSSVMVIDLLGEKQRIYKSNIVKITPCVNLDANVINAIRTVCIRMNQKEKMDREYAIRTKEFDKLIAANMQNLAQATGLMKAEQFERAMAVALDKKYGSDMTVSVVRTIDGPATIHISEFARIRKYPTVEEFPFLTVGYGNKKFHINHESTNYHRFVANNAPDARNELDSISCGVVVGASIGAQGELLAYRRYTVKLEAGLTRTSIDSVINSEAIAIAI